MYVTVVSIRVLPEFLDAFIEATTVNHQNSIQEPGNLRFDFLQSVDDPTYFTLYEAYETKEAAAAHKTQPHYFLWRDTVAPWMAEPRVGIAHESIMPTEVDQW